MLQPLAEVNLFGKTDEVRGRGAGLRTLETGLRLRYEIKREIAPYIGVVWNKTFGDTADLARVASDTAQGSRVVAGVRLWY